MSGRWRDTLSRLLSWFVDDSFPHSLITPTLADPEYEVDQARGRLRRWRAYLLGYGALVRVVMVHGVVWRLPMRRMLAVLLLGSAGTALLITAFATTKGPVQISPFFLPALVAPLLLRLFGLGPTYRQMFVNCVGVGTLMAMFFYGCLMIDVLRGPIEFGSLVPLAFSMVGVLFVSALAAAIAAPWPVVGIWVFRRLVIGLAAGSVIFALTFSGVVPGSFRPGWGNKPVLQMATGSWALFLGVFFTGVATVVHLPVLLAARRLLRRRVWLVLIGALLFPIPMVGFPFLRGHLAWMWRLWIQHPDQVVGAALPSAIAGATLGWFLSVRPEQMSLAGCGPWLGKVIGAITNPTPEASRSRSSPPNLIRPDSRGD